MVAVAWLTSSARDWGVDASRSFPTPGSGTFELSAGTYSLWRTGPTGIQATDVQITNLDDHRTANATGKSGLLGFVTGIGNDADVFAEVALPTSGRWRFSVSRNLGEDVALGPSKSSLTWIVIGALVLAAGLIALIVLVPLSLILSRSRR